MWRPLYRIGAAAGAVVLVLMAIQVIAYMRWPLPHDAEGWLTLFAGRPIVGLISMDLLLTVDFVLLALLVAAVAASVRGRAPGLAGAALLLEVVAVAAYMASTTAIEMLTLSGQYAAAPPEARALIVAAAHAVLARWQGTAFTFSYIVSGLALILLAVAMRRSGRYRAITAQAGLAAGLLSLVPANAGGVGLVMSFLSLIPTVAWIGLTTSDLRRVET